MGRSFAFVAVGLGDGDVVAHDAAQDADVFTPRERRSLAPKSAESRTARLAAKRAVIDLVGGSPALGDVEVTPAPIGLCHDPFRCAQGHPLRVTVRGRAPSADGAPVGVSVSHAGGVAVALAYSVTLPEEGAASTGKVQAE